MKSFFNHTSMYIYDDIYTIYHNSLAIIEPNSLNLTLGTKELLESIYVKILKIV